MTDNHITPDDESLAEDLARRISEMADGKPCDAVMLGLSMATAAVMRSAGDGDYMIDATGFAAMVVNVHAGLDSGPEVGGVITTVGNGEPLSRATSEAATVLCQPLGLLMTGLLMHYEGKNVVNSWLSVLLNVLLESGVEKAQTILRETADALPRAAAQMAALRAMDDGVQYRTGGESVMQALFDWLPIIAGGSIAVAIIVLDPSWVSLVCALLMIGISTWATGALRRITKGSHR